MDLRQHKAPEVETSAHGVDYHISPLTNWFVAGVVALLSDPGAPERSIDYFRERMDEAPTATELLDMRPSTAVVADSEPHLPPSLQSPPSGRSPSRICSPMSPAYPAEP